LSPPWRDPKYAGFFPEVSRVAEFITAKVKKQWPQGDLGLIDLGLGRSSANASVLHSALF
jgi:hypothetical protein